MNSVQKSHYTSRTTYFKMITERSAVMLISTNLINKYQGRDWHVINQDFNMCLVDVYNMKIMAYLQAFPSVPPSSPTPPASRFFTAQNPLSLSSNACHAVVRYLTTALTRPISMRGFHGHKLIYRFRQPNADWILKKHWKVQVAFFFFNLQNIPHFLGFYYFPDYILY